MNELIFNGHSSREFGMVITGAGTYNAPERDVDKLSVPGRNGDLIFDNGRFKNIPVKYPVSIAANFPAMADKARAWLLSDFGYRRLADSYNPEYFRLARFQGPLDFDVQFLNRSGEASLVFDCKPQRFLLSGESPILMETPGSLYNFTMYPAEPLIEVFGSGACKIGIGGVIVTISNMENSLILDCSAQNAYRIAADGGIENQNGAIYAPVFPVLSAGTNVISWLGNISKIKITPRWWTV